MPIGTALIAFVGVLVVLILVHELGHFVTAKLTGVKVEEFGLGYPPRIVGVKWRGTEYSLNALPLGGFVRLLGEEDPKDPGSFASKRKSVRFLVLSSGSLMNFLLPALLLSLTFMIPQQVPQGPVSIEEVAPGTPAEQAGLRAGDVILEINDHPVRNTPELIRDIHLNLGKEIALAVQRDGGRQIVRATPRWAPPPGEGPLGIRSQMKEFTLVTESHPFWEAIPLGMRTLVNTFKLFRNEIGSMFARGTAPEVTGPVGIFRATGEVAQGGVSPLLSFAAFISINLGIVNLLPIPALDGGRLFFLLIEAARRGKRISPSKERLVHLVGFAVLITMIVVVTYFDVLRWIGGS
ncbi:MAG: site-2 protease family protein [Chloroflexi bacterium]|nr:site-2 protease family protein [Chloroflexota bacterium]